MVREKGVGKSSYYLPKQHFCVLEKVALLPQDTFFAICQEKMPQSSNSMRTKDLNSAPENC